MLLTFFAIASSLVTTVWLVEQCSKQWRQRSLSVSNHCEAPPSVKGQGFLGLSFLRYSYESIQDHSYLSTAKDRFSKHGNTYEFKMAGSRVINTIEPENVRSVLSRNFDDFSLGPRRKHAFGPLIGYGIFTADSDWDQQRKLLRPHFAKDHFADVSHLDKHVGRLLHNIPTDKSTVDLQDLFFQFTIDTATEFLMGQSTDSLLTPGGDQFSISFDRAQRGIADRFALGKLSFLLPRKQFKQDTAFVQKRADEIIHLSLEAQHKVGKDVEDSDEHQFVFLTELAKVVKDRDLLRSAILNLLVAGRDTTASLLSNLWFILARRPDIWARLQEGIEVLEGEKPTYEQIKGLTYLKHCLNESLRLHPPIPINTRTCVNDTVLPTGGGLDGKSPILVRKGDMVGYQVYSMHRIEEHFGVGAESFVPERWDDLRPGWAYLPFNGGPRLCLGQQYALTEASYLTVRLLQAFSSIAPRDDEPWSESLTLSCSSKNGTKVALSRRT